MDTILAIAGILVPPPMLSQQRNVADNYAVDRYE